MILPNYNAVKERIKNSNKCVVIPHRNPDGDAVGSTLALCEYLQKKGCDSVVISPNEAPNFLQWMPGYNEVVVFENDREKAKALINDAELIFTLDFNHLSRVGSEFEAVLEAATADFIMIDHHQQPDTYSVETFSDTQMSSTCEMVYHFIDQLGDKELIDINIASCIYAGILTDTGQFKFPNTTSTTHKIAAFLIECGANNHEIHRQIYDTNSPSKLGLLGCTLKSMEILKEYRTAVLKLSQEELDTFHYQKGDTEGFVNYGLSLDGIVFSVIFIEHKEEGIVKISFRSQGDFSVNEFARSHFNGGGHNNAAGGRSEDSLLETIEKFKKILPQYKTQLHS